MIQGSSFFKGDDGESIVPEYDHLLGYWFREKQVDSSFDHPSLKFGDTNNIIRRLGEWKNDHGYDIVDADDFDNYRIIGWYSEDDGYWIYTRDYTFHKIFEEDFGWKRVKDCLRIENFHLSQEFYYDPDGNIVDHITHDFVESLIEDIIKPDYYSNEAKRFKFMVPDKDGGLSTGRFRYSPSDDYQPRGYQNRVASEVTDKHFMGNNLVMLSAPTRSGKCFSAMLAVERQVEEVWEKKTGNVIVVASGIVDVKDEWKKTVEKHKRFGEKKLNPYTGEEKKPFAFLDAQDIDAHLGKGENAVDEMLEEADNVVVFLSIQDLSGSTTEKAYQSKMRHDVLLDDNAHSRVSYALADECHFGLFSPEYGKAFLGEKEIKETIDHSEDDNDSELVDDSTNVRETTKRFQSLSPEFGMLYITATPFNILTNSSFTGFSIDNNVVMVYPQEITAEHETWCQENPDKDPSMSPYAGMPEKLAFAVDVGDIEQLLAYRVVDAKKGAVKWAHEAKVKKLIKDMWKKEVSDKDSAMAPNFFGSKEFESAEAGRHLMFVLPRKITCDLFEDTLTEVLTELGVIDEYDVFNISGRRNLDGYSSLDAQSVKLKVSQSNKKTIILTVNKMTTGVTISKLDTVLIMTNSGSVTKQLQTMGRPNTPHLSSDGSGEKRHVLKQVTALIHFSPFALYSTLDMEDRLYRAANSNKSNNINDRDAEGLLTGMKVYEFNTLEADAIMRKMDIIDMDKKLRKELYENGIYESAKSVAIDVTKLTDKHKHFLSDRSISAGSDFDSQLLEVPDESEHDEEDLCDSCGVYEKVRDDMCAGCWNRESLEAAKKSRLSDSDGEGDSTPEEDDGEDKQTSSELRDKIAQSITLLLLSTLSLGRHVSFGEMYQSVLNNAIGLGNVDEDIVIATKNAMLTVDDLILMKEVVDIDDMDHRLRIIFDYMEEMG